MPVRSGRCWLLRCNLAVKDAAAEELPAIPERVRGATDTARLLRSATTVGGARSGIHRRGFDL